jgi:hypothetical protein
MEGDTAQYVTSGLPGVTQPTQPEKRISDPSLPPFAIIDTFPDPQQPHIHPYSKGATPGYIAMEMNTDEETPQHYTRFTTSEDPKVSPFVSRENLPSVGYSRVGSLLDPAGLNDLRQRVKPPVRGVMVGEEELNKGKDVRSPGTGYVAFNSIKTPPQAKAASPGYITIDQINWT